MSTLGLVGRAILAAAVIGGLFVITTLASIWLSPSLPSVDHENNRVRRRVMQQKKQRRLTNKLSDDSTNLAEAELHRSSLESAQQESACDLEQGTVNTRTSVAGEELEACAGAACTQMIETVSLDPEDANRRVVAQTQTPKLTFRDDASLDAPEESLLHCINVRVNVDSI